MYSFVLLSAGKGLRFGSGTPKQYLPLAGKPMIIHALENVDRVKKISEVIIVCHPDYKETIEKYISEYNIKKPVMLVNGGETRQESVYSGLKVASGEHVILHEAARPLVSVGDFEKLINCPYDNVSYTYSIPYTVLKKSKDNFVSDILNRNELINIQLPQKFVKKDLLEAHEKAIASGTVFTEDAGILFQHSNKKVFCLEGKPYNIKITEYADLLFAETLYKEEMLKG